MARKPLTWGVLGTGTIARLALLPVLGRLREARLVGIASADPDRAATRAAEFGIPRAYESYAALLDDADIACVYIALPNHLHHEWAMRAAAAGKHVLCEKPLALRSTELDEMEAACQTAHVHLMEALMYRFHPRMARLRRLLDEGAIGVVHSVHASFCFTQTDASNYRRRPEQGGGALWDVGGYCVDAARLVMGEEPLAAQAVAHYAPSGIDDQVSGQLEFADGRAAHLVCSFRSAEQQCLTVVGTSGVLHIPWPFTAWRSDQAPIVVWRGADEETLPGDPADPYQLMVAAFTAAVRDGAPVPHALAASRATLRAVTALAEAARTGQRTEISSAVGSGATSASHPHPR